MVQEVEGIHQIGSHSLYTKSWIPDSSPQAKLVFIHGYSDHINRYYDFFPTLASRGIEVRAFDQRGWGRSVHKPSERGLTGPTSQVLSDIASFVKTLLPCPVPLFILGHSMGGGEVLTFACDPQYSDVVRNVRGWLFESPFIRFPKGFEPPWIKVFLGKLAARLIPTFKLHERLAPENLTRMPEVAKSIDADELLHNTGTLEGLANMLERAAALDEGRARLSKDVKSIWVGHGTADHGTSYEGSKEWFDRQTQVEDKEFKTYENAYHMLHADLPEITQQFIEDVGNWILARCKNEPTRAVESKL